MAAAHLPPAVTLETQHNGTEHLAINNTFVNQFLTLLALKTTAKFYKRDGHCIRISKHRIIKSGFFVHLTEAATMKFVAEHTSIPVPKVYCSFVRENRAFIVMQRIPGEHIPSAWGKLSEESKQKIFDRLRELIRELRSLRAPDGTGVKSCVGGSLCGARIVRPQPRFGPFKTIQKFHLWLRQSLQASEHPDQKDDQDWRDIKDMAAKQDGPWQSPVFTHADLNTFNILVHGDDVVGIIDWEFSGWYPHYWEYTSNWLGSITKTG
jgi:tRNA A-37 threonylcarbamoyl transferase component Bud32